MQLVYMNREMYRQRNTPVIQEYLQQRFGEVFVIPEGGSNLNGVRGCTEIIGDAMLTAVTGAAEVLATPTHLSIYA